MQKIDIYLTGLGAGDCLSVPAGTDIATLDLPAEHRPPYRTYSRFRDALAADPERGSDSYDVADVLRQIEEKGYALHRADFVIRVNP